MGEMRSCGGRVLGVHDLRRSTRGDRGAPVTGGCWGSHVAQPATPHPSGWLRRAWETTESVPLGIQHCLGHPRPCYLAH